MEQVINTKSTQQLRKSVFSAVVGQLGSQTFNFALALMILIKTGSSLSFAASQIIAPIISILFVPLVGPLVDKVSKKIIIAISQLVTISALLLYAIFFHSIENNLLVPSLILITVLVLSDQFTSTAYNAGAKGLVLDDHQTKLRGMKESAGALGQFIAPIIGAALYSLVPFYIFIAIEVGCELITLVIALTLNFRLNLAEEAVEEAQDLSFRAGLTFFRKQKILISLLSLALMMNLCVAAFTIGIASVFINALHFPTTYYGFVESALFFGMIVSGIVVGQMKPSKQPLEKIWWAMLVLVPCLASFGIAPSLFGATKLTLALIILATLIMAAMANMINVPFFAWMGEQIPAHYQGRIFSLSTTFAMALTPLGFALFGILYDLKTVPLLTINLWVFLTCALVVVGLFIVGKFIIKIDLKNAEIIK